MRNFEDLFGKKRPSTASSLSLLSASAPIRVYYGYGVQGSLRLAFMSSVSAPEMQSTKAIRVSVQKESDTVNWLFFDLVDSAAKAVYFTLCDDLVAAVENLQGATPQDGFECLKNRFSSWRKMFRQECGTLTDEQLAGLWGELYFMDRFMIPEFGGARAVSAWSGVDGTCKDFSIDSKWYEVKNVSLNANVVKISSLAQLSANEPGALVIIRHEVMSPSYDAPDCTIFRLFRKILSSLLDDDVRAQLISKLVNCGFEVLQETATKCYRAVDMNMYKVDGDFPRLQEQDVPFREIDKVSYTLLINSIDRFKFDGRL